MVMPVSSGSGATNAPQCFSGRQFAPTNCGMNCPPSTFSVYVSQIRAISICFALLGAGKTTAVISKRFCFAVLAEIFFAFVGLFVLATRFFASVGLLIFTMASITATTVATFLRSIYVKLSNWQNVLAFRARFVCNGLRHNQFLSNWLLFRAATNYTLVCGSFHYRDSRHRFQHENSKF